MPAATAAAATDPWRLVRHGHRKATRAQEESLFALANGSLGVRGGIEEGHSPSQGSFLSGAWERTPIEYHERFPGFARSTDTRVPVADGTRIGLRLGDTAVQLDRGEWLEFTRSLDLRHGCMQRSLRWRSADGATLDIRAERLVALDTPGLLAIRYCVRSIDYSGPITLESAIDTARDAVGQGEDPRIGTRIDGGLRNAGAAADQGQAWVRQHTSHSDIQVLCGQRHLLREGELAFATANAGPHGVVQTYAGTLQPGRQLVLEKYVAYAWTMPAEHAAPDGLPGQVEHILQQAAAAGYATLAQRQSLELERFWAATDLAICGDAETELALRLNLFHVYQSSPRDSGGSIAAKGLTGEGYEGHYFWDAEAFMLPAMVGLAPELARHMLAYRYRTLDRARLHAREMNHARGALYPWRTISGGECSAYFPSGSAQYHINAAIAWAIRLYVDASGDDAFLQAMGAEMLFETARIWLDVGHFNARRGGAFCIHEVTGPDEYSALVDNNHYTNRMAQRHLRDAAAVARRLAAENPAAYAALSARIGLHAEECAQWQRAADAMYLPVDARLGIFPQDDGFLDKPRLPPQNIDAGKQPLLLRMHPLTIYRHQVCKQADALLALVLAGDDVDREAKQRNLAYYEPVTVHDSTLSASTFAILAAEVGQLEKASGYFHETLRVDLDDLHGNAGHGLHMAAMAGSWLALSWGFGGLRVIDGVPSLAPSLPPEWTGYRFGLRWRDSQLRVEVDADGVCYSLTAGTALDFRHAGVPQHLRAGQSLRLPHTVAATDWPALPHAFKAVIFDLDGVIADTAVVHHAAWKQLAAEIGIPFDDAIGDRLKGVDRAASLDIVLENAGRRYTAAEKLALADRKNALYRDRIEHFGPADMLPGARRAIESARRAGLRIGLASASRNASLLLQRMQIADLFDHVVDAGTISQAKPHPEIFLAAARGLGVQPSECLGVEDAAAGVTSIHAAGMAAIGIGHADALAEADVVLPSVAELDIGRFLKR
ncbi:MAG: beta-phosphoglucomutase [Xanthomonadaceae bacterium]|nr:beta-phosphoglucomutase [Xanthomonadaceae bacterium]